MAASDKTEKATPKKRAEARKKGSVAKSADLNGAVVMMAALFALSATAPHLVATLQTSLREAFQLIATPGVVDHRGLGPLLSEQLGSAALAAAPVIFTCIAAGLVVNIAQVGGKPHMTALKPDPKRLNPLQGFKSIYGPNALFEGGKSIAKVGAVGAVTALAVLPKFDEYGALVGMPPTELMPTLAHTVLGIAQRAGMAYLLIGLVDYVYQRYRHEKSLKMDKEEVKQESKGQELPAEVKGAIRRRQIQAARARMMADVPTADVVVTNPTHFAVALKYDAQKAAPEVVAKGSDLLAKKIREIAADAGVPVVADPPLARSLHATVEVGHIIPEELYQAVAQLLAFVYRTARRRALA
jgi:flagellar biosynthetic protein FlhB